MFSKVRPRKTGASSFPGFEIIICPPPAPCPSLHARFRNGNTITALEKRVRLKGGLSAAGSFFDWKLG